MRLIDADALKSKVEAMVIHKFNESDYEYGRNQAFDYVADILIDDAPTIDAVQGEWITIDTEVTSVPVYWNEEQCQSDERGASILEKCECSVCGWKTNFMGYKKLGVNKLYNYCPSCGVRMKGGDTE